jgi:hypothetical protein
VTTAILVRRAKYLQVQVYNYRLRREYGIPGLEERIEATLNLLMLAEENLAERGLYLRSDGEIVNLPPVRDKRPRAVA